MKIVTGDEAYVHIFEPQRKMDDKKWARRNARRPVIAKRTLSGKKVMLVLFFDIIGHIVQASVPRGRPVARTFYKRRILEKFYKYLKKCRPKTGLRGHDNAPAHTSSVVTCFFTRKKVTVLSHPPLIVRPGI